MAHPQLVLEDDRKYMVFASSYQMFNIWCQKHQVSPRDKRIKYVSRLEVLLGYEVENMVIVRTTGWVESPLYQYGRWRETEPYIEMLIARGAKVVYDRV